MKDDLEEGAKLGKELCAILTKHFGERGDNEGAVETLQRIIRERDAWMDRSPR